MTVCAPQGPTILVVDDSAAVRLSLTESLSREGYCVVSAGNGLEALALVQSCQPVAILADASMPTLDGFRTCAIIKQSKLAAHIPVIIMSSRMGVVDQARSRACGADAQLQKPLSAAILRDAMNRCGAAGAGSTVTSLRPPPSPGAEIGP